jgi:hypothetical protein
MTFDQLFLEKTGWEPFEGQKLVLEAFKSHRDIIINAGRQWGKSMLCGRIVAETFIQAIKDGKPIKIWITAPTYELASKVFNYAVRWLLMIDKTIQQFVSTRPPQNITVSVNQWIQCKSATEPMSLLGEAIDLNIVDEAPLVSDNVYQQYILPPYISAKGKNVYIGTPRGKNWFYKKYVKGTEGVDVFHFKSTEGKAIAQTELDKIKNEYPDERLFKQEYEAVFIDNAGQVFYDFQDIVLPRAHIWQDAIPGNQYAMGVDIAKTEDFTVITVIDKNTYKEVYQKRYQGLDYAQMSDDVILTAKRYNNARIVLDTTGVGEPFKDFLARRGVMVEDFQFSGSSKEELIGKLKLMIDHKLIRISDEPNKLKELESFEFKTINEKTGEPLQNIKYGAVKGFHDDCIMSLALAVWGLTMDKPRTMTPIQKELAQAQLKKRVDSFI